MIATTTIGSYPKPDYVPVSDWFSASSGPDGPAGCVHVQVDEPVMARKPEAALAHGIDHLSRCFDGVPTGS